MDEPLNTVGNGKEATYFKPGNPGKAPGTQNKLTKTVKETVLAVFNEIQADPKVKLSQFAKDYPRDFYQIASKLIPTEVQGELKATLFLDQILGMKLIEDGVTT